MPRYYFQLRNGSDILLDPEGRSLSGLAAVKLAASIEVRALICQEVREGRIDLGQRLDIENTRGDIIHSLPFAEAVEIVGALGATGHSRRKTMARK